MNTITNLNGDLIARKGVSVENLPPALLGINSIPISQDKKNMSDGMNDVMWATPSSAVREAPDTIGRSITMDQESGSGAQKFDLMAALRLLMALMQEVKDASRTQRAVEVEATVKLLIDGAAKLRSAADEVYKGAFAKGIMTIASGMIEAGAGVATMGKVSGIKGEISRNQQLKLDSFMGTARGGSGVIGSLGGIVDARQQGKAAQLQAVEKELESLAKRAEASKELSEELLKEVIANASAIISAMREYEQGNTQANNTAIRV